MDGLPCVVFHRLLHTAAVCLPSVLACSGAAAQPAGRGETGH